ncbi:MAG TPA: ANTAR domain-containing protein [Gaiellaceae bacterium]|jgi:hypothetical protein|nr:ANTAR domain-containing protein [Gaiellaceae bacterium]
MDGDTPTTDVDVRVAQLQHALTSRIVVEQAKGMLAERYSLTTEDAFELIRLAARSNGIKVHALSHSVVESPRQTPARILDLFTTLPRNSVAPARAVENVFRQVNESFLKLDNPRFICECSVTSCIDPIDVSAETMRSLHENRDLYVVKPAHINTDLEELVESHDEFVIVRKPAAS